MNFFNRRIAALLMAAGLPLISQASVTVGTGDPGTGNCYPFGCAYGGEYQQVYSSTQFSGSMTIGALDFYNTKFDSSATAMNTGTWTISLSTTSASVNGLGTPGSANLGADNTLVFSGNLSQPWTFGDTLHIALSQAFTYNPASGNLLMDVEVSDPSAPGGYIFFDMQQNSGVMSREYHEGGTDGLGLVTTFESASVSTVPEPSVALLFVAGLGLVAGMSQRRRNATAAAAI